MYVPLLTTKVSKEEVLQLLITMFSPSPPAPMSPRSAPPRRTKVGRASRRFSRTSWKTHSWSSQPDVWFFFPAQTKEQARSPGSWVGGVDARGAAASKCLVYTVAGGGGSRSGRRTLLTLTSHLINYLGESPPSSASCRKSHHASALKLIRFHPRHLTRPPLGADASHDRPTRRRRWLGWLRTPPPAHSAPWHPMSKSARRVSFFFLLLLFPEPLFLTVWAKLRQPVLIGGALECRSKLQTSAPGPLIREGGRAGARCYPPPCAHTQRLYWFWIMLCVSFSRANMHNLSPLGVGAGERRRALCWFCKAAFVFVFFPLPGKGRDCRNKQKGQSEAIHRSAASSTVRTHASGSALNPQASRKDLDCCSSDSEYTFLTCSGTHQKWLLQRGRVWSAVKDARIKPKTNRPTSSWEMMFFHKKKN